MANEQLKQLGYEEIGESFCDQPGITDEGTESIRFWRNSSKGEEILVLHKRGSPSADRYFKEVKLQNLKSDASSAKE